MKHCRIFAQGDWGTEFGGFKNYNKKTSACFHLWFWYSGFLFANRKCNVFYWYRKIASSLFFSKKKEDYFCLFFSWKFWIINVYAFFAQHKLWLLYLFLAYLSFISEWCKSPPRSRFVMCRSLQSPVLRTQVTDLLQPSIRPAFGGLHVPSCASPSPTIFQYYSLLIMSIGHKHSAYHSFHRYLNKTLWLEG